MIDLSLFKLHFRYDEDSGKIFWQVLYGNARNIKEGDEAGGDSNGARRYRLIKFMGKWYPTHRVVWYIHDREIPDGYYIDHLDGNKTNNRIDNLRLVTCRQNQQNQHRHRKGKLVGACFDKARGLWISKININNKQCYLGRFGTEEEAHEAYMRAVEKLKEDQNNE
jgi:hypothetical protein